MRNVKPSASGQLATTPVAHLLLYTGERRRSGTLHLRWGSRAREDAVWIRLEGGIIRRLRGCDARGELRAVLAPLCDLRAGRFAFYDDVDLVAGRPGACEGRLDPRALLTHALRGGARDDIVTSTVEKLRQHQLQLRSDVDLAVYDFDERERAFVRRLAHRPHGVVQLEQTPGMPRATVHRLIYLLRATKAVALLPAGRRARSGTLRVPSGPLAAVMPQPPASAGLGTGPAMPPPPPLDSPPDPHGPPGALPAALRSRWTEVVLRSQRIRGENYFQMLGVESHVTTPEVHAAFARAAKRWHPDRLPPELAPLTERVREIFSLLSEARDALGSPAGRLEHLGDIDAGGGTPDTRHTVSNALRADASYQKGLMLMRQKRFDEALLLVREAIALDGTSAEYLATCGWLMHQAEGTAAGMGPGVERMLRDALRMNPRCERAHHYFGSILKQCGREQDALEHFERAHMINPKNIEAERELRVARMRAERAEQRQRDGSRPLLGRLLAGRPPWKGTGSD